MAIRVLCVIMVMMLAASGASGAPVAGRPALDDVQTPIPSDLQDKREALYCQPVEFTFLANASTAFDSEVADDLPGSLDGSAVEHVTLYVAEWMDQTWRDPVGLNINFYGQRCPPSLDPNISYYFDWDDLDVVLVDYEPPTRIVYSAKATLPEPLTIAPGMSLGAQVVIDWSLQPYAGLALTAEGDIYGCSELYWDDATHGAPRWTSISTAAGYSSDLAFCLSGYATGMISEFETTWGVVKHLYR